MLNHNADISASELLSVMHTADAPVVVDVRRLVAFEKAERMVATAVWRDHVAAAEWGLALPEENVVVYCVHGQQVSQAAVALLQAQGVEARYLAGGFDAWREAGGVTTAKKQMTEYQGKHWVTPQNSPDSDALACAWLVRRFIDAAAAFHYVEAEWTHDIAMEIDGVPFAAGDAANLADFDAFVRHFEITDSAVHRLAELLRGTESAMLRRGLSSIYAADAARLEAAMVPYDALYRACRDAG